MKYQFSYQDHYYPFTYTTHTRIITRCVLLNEKNQVALIHVVDDDEFGHRDCYETPGGGKKKNETLHQSVKRETLEETGYQSSIIKYLGYVTDYYNLIHRKNHIHYYLLRCGKFVKQHLEDYEKDTFKDIKFYDIDDAISLMKKVDDDGVGHLIKQRELPILELAKEYINEHPINK